MLVVLVKLTKIEHFKFVYINITMYTIVSIIMLQYVYKTIDFKTYISVQLNA